MLGRAAADRCPRGAAGAGRRAAALSAATTARAALAALAIVGPSVALAAGEPAAPDVDAAVRAEAQRNLPEVGRSLFDFVVSAPGPTGPALRVPFPFEALVAEIESHVVADGVRTTLFPLGRSLQRAGGGPDFFASPRIVLAVVGEPAQRPDRPTLLLKDRLFVGYQPKLSQLEVISYNEAAGRFEFEVVKDYAADRTPRVVYTDRTLCGRCHQAGSPIFSRPPWSETPANRHVRALLARERARFDGVPAEHGFDVPKAFDDATDRAGMLGVWQALWTRGCAAARSEADARACRADALLAMLVSRLSPASRRGAGETLLERAVAYALDRGFDAAFPSGLAIPDVDIPNRDPLVGHRFASGAPATRHEFGATPDLAPDEIAAFADVEAILEPGNERAPREVWREIGETPGRAAAVVAGFGSFLADADVRALDRRLSTAARGAEISTFDATCAENALPSGPTLFRCDGVGPADEPLRLVVSTRARDGRIASATLREIDAGPLGRLANVELIAEPATGPRRTTRLRAREPELGLSARFETGDALSTVEIAKTGRGAVRARVAIRRDRDVLDAAVARVRDAGDDALSGRPLRRASVLSAVHASLGGAPSGPRCCASDAPDLPPPQFGVP